MKRNPWLVNSGFDLAFIVGPAFIVSFACLLLFAPSPDVMRAEVPLGMWLLFVLGIDVAHVYSTLFRTYFDSEERERYQAHLLLIPLFCWAAGVLLYSLGSVVFWSVLAYAAVFHFVRQQYGFYSLYARLPSDKLRHSREIDTAAVYLGALYPLVYWHEHLPRTFVWFIDGDFPFQAPSGSATLFGWALVAALTVSFIKEIAAWLQHRAFNLPKNLIIWGTALAWYVGIVHFNGDVPFTVTNVVAHGVPYMALIWVFGRRKLLSGAPLSPFLARCFTLTGAGVFLLLLIVFAGVEETLWDALVWRERESLFGWAWALPQMKDSKVLALLVPLLAVPQATHYVLDAFIWRLRKPSGEVNHLLLREQH